MVLRSWVLAQEKSSGLLDRFCVGLWVWCVSCVVCCVVMATAFISRLIPFGSRSDGRSGGGSASGDDGGDEPPCTSCGAMQQLESEIPKGSNPKDYIVPTHIVRALMSHRFKSRSERDMLSAHRKQRAESAGITDHPAPVGQLDAKSESGHTPVDSIESEFRNMTTLRRPFYAATQDANTVTTTTRLVTPEEQFQRFKARMAAKRQRRKQRQQQQQHQQQHHQHQQQQQPSSWVSDTRTSVSTGHSTRLTQSDEEAALELDGHTEFDDPAAGLIPAPPSALIQARARSRPATQSRSAGQPFDASQFVQFVDEDDDRVDTVSSRSSLPSRPTTQPQDASEFVQFVDEDDDMADTVPSRPSRPTRPTRPLARRRGDGGDVDGDVDGFDIYSDPLDEIDRVGKQAAACTSDPVPSLDPVDVKALELDQRALRLGTGATGATGRRRRGARRKQLLDYDDDPADNPVVPDIDDTVTDTERPVVLDAQGRAAKQQWLDALDDYEEGPHEIAPARSNTHDDDGEAAADLTEELLDPVASGAPDPVYFDADDAQEARATDIRPVLSNADLEQIDILRGDNAEDDPYEPLELQPDSDNNPYTGDEAEPEAEQDEQEQDDEEPTGDSVYDEQQDDEDQDQGDSYDLELGQTEEPLSQEPAGDDYIVVRPGHRPRYLDFPDVSTLYKDQIDRELERSDYIPSRTRVVDPIYAEVENSILAKMPK